MSTRPRKRPQSPGQRLQGAVLAACELEPHEQALLTEATRTADLCGALQNVLDDEGLMVPTRTGTRVHPAAVELRAQRITLARLLVALRIPTDADGEPIDHSRSQRRGLRGVYGMGA